MVLVGLIPGMKPRSTARNAAVAAGYVLLGLGVAIAAGGSGIVLPTDSVAGPSAAAEPTATAASTPTPTAAVEPRVETAVRESITDGYVRSIDELTVDSRSGGVAVAVTYRLAPDRLVTLRDRERDLLHHHATSAAVLERLYTDGLPMREVRIRATVPVRRNGERSERVVSTVVLTEATAGDIAWGQFMPQDLPRVADEYAFENQLYR
jgi:hypothetical protein